MEGGPANGTVFRRWVHTNSYGELVFDDDIILAEPPSVLEEEGVVFGIARYEFRRYEAGRFVFEFKGGHDEAD